MQGGARMTRKNRSKPAAVLDALALWLSARAALVLVLLMVQVGLVLALFSLYNSSSVQGTASATRGGVGMKCGAYEVLFVPDVTMASLRQWALNFGAQIVAGPNSRGAFELQVAQLDLEQLQQALGAQALDVRINALCPLQEAQ